MQLVQVFLLLQRIKDVIECHSNGIGINIFYLSLVSLLNLLIIHILQK